MPEDGLTKTTQGRVLKIVPTISNRYRFYGFTFEIPGDQSLISVDVLKYRYAVQTDKARFTMRPCRKCMRLMVSECFYPGKSPCKECHVWAVKKWKTQNPEKVAQHKKRNNQKYRDKKKLEEFAKP